MVVNIQKIATFTVTVKISDSIDTELSAAVEMF